MEDGAAENKFPFPIALSRLPRTASLFCSTSLTSCCLLAWYLQTEETQSTMKKTTPVPIVAKKLSCLMAISSLTTHRSKPLLVFLKNPAAHDVSRVIGI